jgi:hypothetical protein
MKIKEVSSNRRSKAGASAQDRSGFVSTAAPTMQRRLGWRSSALHRCWPWDLQQSMRRKQRSVSRARANSTHKDVKYEGRSGNVYENKGPEDNLPDTKDDISARLHAILRKSTRILQKPPAFLPLFEPCGTNPALQLDYTFTRRNAKGFPPKRG